jgi:HPt (histidine-containing phosphotransfer) domain-containing protein
MDDYISKPVDAGILNAKLGEVAARLGGAAGDMFAADVSAAPDVVALDDALSAAGIDKSCLDTLNLVMEPLEVRSFVEMYLSETEERIARMLAEQDRAALAGDAHALVSTSGNVGAIRVSQSARTVELACKNGQTEDIPGLLDSLSSAVNAAGGVLTVWVDSQSAP